MDRGTWWGAWWATVHGVARVEHNLATKPPSLGYKLIGSVNYQRTREEHT